MQHNLLMQAGALFLGLYALIIFDWLIKAEYEFFPEIWNSDGEPVGFFFWPVKATFRRGNAGKKMFMTWLFRSPEWIKQSKRYSFWIFQMRVAVFTLNALGVANWVF